jgi:hypothetical protein
MAAFDYNVKMYSSENIFRLWCSEVGGAGRKCSSSGGTAMPEK